MAASHFRSAPCRPSLRAAVRIAALILAFVGGAVPVRAADAPATREAARQEVPPLPSFEGRTLDGKPLSTRSFPGQRLILFCFNPGVEHAADYARALAKVSPERGRHNFAILGVAMGLDPAEARAFAAKNKLDFPILDDSDGQIGTTLGLQSPLMLVGSDADGRVGLAVVGMEHDEASPSAATLEGRVRDYLRLPRAGAAVDGTLEELPVAPPFEAKRLDGGTFRLADTKGRPVVLMFFLSTCSHCQDALRFFRDELARIPENVRPAFVGIAIDNRTWSVESALQEKSLGFFPVLTDEDRAVQTAYGSFAKVPDILMIDASGRIVFRDTGWEGSHDPDVMRMRLARLAGREAPMLLSRTGFSGNDACAVCHAAEAAAWRFTEHASAFDTLVTRGSDRDEKCVGCHVVGFGERGGWTVAGREEHLEDVGCESCHGRGGGHLEPKPKTAAPTDYRPACARCHDAKHSLGFQFEAFLPKVSHAAIAALAPAERAKLVAEQDRPRDLLPKTSAFAGSMACRSCHEKEYATWSRSAHARSVESLRKEGKDDEGKCLACHVTGYDRPGGFPAKGKVRSHEDLARVGCESCHGPGAEHVRLDGKQPAGVVHLGDKCDSCVILQMCGSCHDDANDPGFRFHVEKKIEAQRHGPGPAHGK